MINIVANLLQISEISCITEFSLFKILEKQNHKLNNALKLTFLNT